MKSDSGCDRGLADVPTLSGSPATPRNWHAIVACDSRLLAGAFYLQTSNRHYQCLDSILLAMLLLTP
jgi:hypothetical protein